MFQIKLTRFLSLFVGLIILSFKGYDQNYKKNKYNLEVIGTLSDYEKETAAHPSAKLMPLLNYIPHLKTNFVYATENNFTHSILYIHPKPYALKSAAEALHHAAKILEKKGFGILLFDAYRPYSVTGKMWQIEPDARYAADPKVGSGHNRGISVDITLYKLSTGEMVKMPTRFDNFTDSAHSDFGPLPADISENRRLLKTVMESCGFKQLSTEWWHFSVPNPDNRYKILNLSFDTLNDYFNQTDN